MSDEQQEKRIDIIEMVQKSPDGTHYVDIAPDARITMAARPDRQVDCSYRSRA
jgi:hypothetical protein